MTETSEDVDTGEVSINCLSIGTGPVVIALHGFPDCRETFRPIVPMLVGAGYRVVLPALRGYAPSGLARSGRHDAVAAGTDVVRVADHFAPGAPVRLVGHDWGAVAATVATVLAPRRFSHLVTMAVPHSVAFVRSLASPAQLRRSWYVGLFQVPVLAEARLAADDFALIDRLWRDWSPDYSASAGELRAVKDGIRGRVKPVLGYYRALRSPWTLFRARAAFARVHVPTLHVHGDRDGCIGVASCDGAERRHTNGYALRRVSGAGHFLTRERPAEVGGIVTDFLGTRR